ncbi:hypothetical protein [Hyphomicrobium sp. MC1]|uniref:hypothetical protein n=1 Tax=Hyphomicrobium sp. (strain MC1) TaxID=717785 RepID=UPI000213EFA9|nr:hypothetical protein [Hyphomicrobium sp. MC1]CCB65481.1 protein of unknown function [Hyphomicrobium sp. MC1]
MSIDQLFDPQFPGTTPYIPADTSRVRNDLPKVKRANNVTYHHFMSSRDTDTSNKVCEGIKEFVAGRMCHRPQGEKDGAAIIGAELIRFEGQKKPNGETYKSGRLDEFVSSISLLQIDIDNTDKETKQCRGRPIGAEDIEAWFAKTGYQGYYYTTFSHRPEWPRFRVVLFFNKPFKIRDHLHDPEGQQRAKLYQEGYAALAQGLCGDNWDRSCKNLSRIFYCPAYPKDNPDAKSWALGKFIDGNPIDFDEVVQKLSPVPTRRANLRSKSRVVSAKRQQFDVIWRAVRQNFDAASFVSRHDRTAKERTAEKVEFFCPFDEEHGHPDGEGSGKTPAVAFSPAAAQHQTATLHCLHDGCHERTPGDFVFAILERERLDFEDLREFLDDEGESRFDDAVATLVPDYNQVDEAISAVDAAERGKKDGLAFTAVNMIARLPAGVDSERAIAALVQVWGKSETRIAKMVRDERKAQRTVRALEAEFTEFEENPDEVFPGQDFDSALAKATQLLEAGNGKNPRIFYSPFQQGYVRIPSGREDPNLETLSSEAKWIHEIGKHVRCMHRCKTRGKYSIPPPQSLIRGIYGNPELLVPNCQSIVHVPLFDTNGKLRTERGYDGFTKSYLIPWGKFRAIPDEILPAHVADAVALLMLAIRDFPFSDNFVGVDPLPVRVDGETDDDGFPAPNLKRGRSSRAHALAMLLTPIARNLIRGPTPIHFIDKPKPGTGAGFLLDLLFHVIEGRRASVFALGLDEAERGKQITTKLAAGKAIIAADNINHHVDDAALAAAISGGYWEGRKLGKSEDVEVPINATYVFACNTGSLSQELMERVLPIRMDAALDNPANERPATYYKLHALGKLYGEWLEANKLELVWALHILIAAWLQEKAKGYVYDGRVQPRFPDYSRVIGGILEVAGVEGFALNREAYLASRNDERQVHREALLHLFRINSENPFSAADASSHLATGDGNRLKFDILPRERRDRTRSSEGLQISVGRWLASMCAQAVHALPDGTTVALTKAKRNGAGEYSFEKM